MLVPDRVEKGLVLTGKDLSLPYSELHFGKQRMRFAESNRISHKRVDTLHNKEPVTTAWLETFTKDDVLWDIGANVGTYTVYSSVLTHCRVVAFEPEALNYAELHKNLYLNGLYERVRGYCCAASDFDGLDTLYLSMFAAGYSHHDCADNRWEGKVVTIAKSQESRLPQGCVAARLDTVLDKGWVPRPTQIKIDVDGLEWRVLNGATEVLKLPELKCVLVEVDFSLERSKWIMEMMAKAGWQYSIDQVCTDRRGRCTPAQWRAQRDAGQGGTNFIYFRDPAYHTRFAKLFK